MCDFLTKSPINFLKNKIKINCVLIKKITSFGVPAESDFDLFSTFGLRISTVLFSYTKGNLFSYTKGNSCISHTKSINLS